jgi:HEAT repeat protein
MNAPATTLARVLTEITEGAPLSARLLQEFSDLDPASLEAVMQAWPGIPVSQQRLLVDGLYRFAETNTLVSFEDFGRALLKDADAQVRMGAVRLLEESDDPKLVPAFLHILLTDMDAEARREAASALGRFVRLGELEDIPTETLREVEEALLEKANGDDQAVVRRSALEALGYSSRVEVSTLIQSSVRREDPEWRMSALVAIGLSSDERWEGEVLSRLMDANTGVRRAAVEAAGELRLGSARQLLFQVLEEEFENEVSGAAIWSLSQIGGQEARLYIQNLLDLAEDEEDVEYLEEALENLEFNDELNRFDLMSVEPDLDD